MVDVLQLLAASFLFGLTAALSGLLLEIIKLFTTPERRRIFLGRVHEKGANQVLKENLGLTRTRRRKAA